ncbi:MAG: metalloregulator ArsR/SmtB family transcription factor [Pseudomonadota bacterium]|nr:metalloregulator ArsR/SmtB family transcription factor [Pseudomonadota bacterium]
MTRRLSVSELLSGLKAAGEATRLRLLALLAAGELNVKDLTRVLGQSQPRISRHLKLLLEAGLIERFREGSWVYFRLSESGAPAEFARRIVEAIDGLDDVIAGDLARAGAVKKERAEIAQAYFRAHASDWDSIRALHVAEDQVEAAISEALGAGPFDLLVDLGTGTGRILELFGGRARRGIGIDVNRDMLGYARAKLERAGLGHCQVRQGDLFSIALPDQSADAVILHQVLHYLEEPANALKEAARILAPGGRLLVVDFAPHELEFLRDDHAHRRLGISVQQMAQWVAESGLKLSVQRNLAPDARRAGNKLTVSLWVAERPFGRSTARKSRGTMETTG